MNATTAAALAPAATALHAHATMTIHNPTQGILYHMVEALDGLAEEVQAATDVWGDPNHVQVPGLEVWAFNLDSEDSRTMTFRRWNCSCRDSR